MQQMKRMAKCVSVTSTAVWNIAVQVCQPALPCPACLLPACSGWQHVLELDQPCATCWQLQQPIPADSLESFWWMQGLLVARNMRKWLSLTPAVLQVGRQCAAHT